MSKRKPNKVKKDNLLYFKQLSLAGGITHLIVYLLVDSTIYNEPLFWTSIFVCGILLSFYFIYKMELLNPDSYKILKGKKLKLFMIGVCIATVIGSIAIFGNFINGVLMGLNYIGKSESVKQVEYNIEKIVQSKTGGRKTT